ncbi:MAG: hypothetical protein MHPSP_003716, partial [Paramarteilia canceri]
GRNLMKCGEKNMVGQFFNEDIKLSTDKFYTSFLLAKFMLSKNITIIGKLRKLSLKFLKNLDK